MKKLVLAVTVAVLGMAACKEEKETPAPTKARYEYKRTPGVVDEIVGDIFVDTGMTKFTVRGSGFDPSKKSNYHLYILSARCTDTLDEFDLRNMGTGSLRIIDTAEILELTNNTIKFWVKSDNMFSAKVMNGGARCLKIDSLFAYLITSSIDSTNKPVYSKKYDKLMTKKVKNKLFFNILSDTLNWYKNSSKRDTTITLEDITGSNDLVTLYLNDQQLNTKDVYQTFNWNYLFSSDGYFSFNKNFYDQNSNLGLINGFYNITMKETQTGIPIEEKRGKKGVYIKFID